MFCKFFLVVNSVLFTLSLNAQTYFEIVEMRDMQDVPLRDHHMLGAPLSVNIAYTNAYLQIANFTGMLTYPATGMQHQGYYVYAQSDLYGNPTTVDFSGRNYFLMISPDWSHLYWGWSLGFTSNDNVTVKANQISYQRYSELLAKFSAISPRSNYPEERKKIVCRGYEGTGRIDKYMMSTTIKVSCPACHGMGKY